PPRVALDGQVVCRGDDGRALEVRRVGDLVQRRCELPLRRREAHVDDVEPLLDRPPQSREEHVARAGVARAEDARAPELAAGGERAHDPGARGAVPAEISFLVLRHAHLAVLDLDGERALYVADERMSRLDAAVEDADT